MRKIGREAGGEKERGCWGTHLRRCSGRRCRPADEVGSRVMGAAVGARAEAGARGGIEREELGPRLRDWVDRGKEVVGPIGKSRERGWIWRDPEVGDAGGGGMGLMGQGS